MQIEHTDRPARALPFTALERDEHRGPAELFDDARRDDADDARVPPLFGEHDAVRRRQIHLEHELARALERRAVDLLPRRVELLELPRDRICNGVALGEHQLDAAQRAAETSGGVEARRENEPDAARGERASLEARGANHRANAGAFGIVEELEPVAHQHAVLSAQRRDVGDRRERDEVEHLENVVLVAADALS